MPLNPVNHNISMDATESAGTSVHVTTTSCTPPPSYNINLPLEHPCTLPSDCGAPPSYQEAINNYAPPPPSYDSLFGRIREVQKVSKGVFDFIKNIIILLVCTIGFTIIFVMTIVVPICMIIIGGMYLYKCPQGEYIPVYLLVGGIIGVFKQLLHLSAYVRRREERDEERIRQSTTQTVINCFMLAWLIIGTTWVYQAYEPNYDSSKAIYCNKTLYLFAFWLINSIYICFGIYIAGYCSFSVASIAFQRPLPNFM